MGELRQRGKTWWIRYYRAGVRYEESARSTRKGDAVDLLRRREGDISKGIAVTPAMGRMTFDEAAADVVKDYQMRKLRSLDDVERKINLHLKPYFGGRRMAAISTAEITRYVVQRQEAGAADAQINRELAALKRAFRLALRAGKLAQVPYVPMLAESNVRAGFLEREQFESLAGHLPDDLRGAFTFAYLTGWRIKSEVLSLTWGQVDRVNKVVTLTPAQSKNKKGRRLPYADLPDLEQVIKTAWAVRQKLVKQGSIVPQVFHRSGKPIKSYRKAWDTACLKAGYPGRIPHDLRRSAVRNLVRAGVPEKTAMMVTGHKTRSVFDRYDITTDTDVRSALGKLRTGTKKGQSAKIAGYGRFRKSL